MASSKQQPRLNRFISRSNGILVPLIPADELPFNVRLQGVPRAMSLAQTTGMQHAGTEPWTGYCFRLEDSPPQRPSSSHSTQNERSLQQPAAQPSKPFLAPDAMVRLGMQQRASASASAQESPQARPTSAAATSTNWRRPADKPLDKLTDQTQEAIDAIVASNPVATPNGYATPRSTPPPSGAAPDQDKKIYCTHWIRHGECDYTQQGCMYKHEMPDRETLEKIGFRSVPRWWQERTAIRIAGLSSLPTVGAPVKASEWLKRRSSDASDTGDESEVESRAESESESDASAERMADGGKVTANKPTASRPSSETHASLVTASSSEARKLSVNGDLIDLSSLLPTPSPSPNDSEDPVDKSLRHIATPARQPAADGLWASKHAPERNSGSPSQRKVFVPAGDSADYHIARSRRLAKRAEDDSLPRILSDDGAQHKSELQPNKPVQILKREDGFDMSVSDRPGDAQQGLMASIHAPRPSKPAAAGRPDNRVRSHRRAERLGTGCQGLSSSTHAPQPDIAGPGSRSQSPQHTERTGTRNQRLMPSVHAPKANKFIPWPADRTRTDHSNERPNTKRDTDQDRSAASRSERAPRDGCRPRRPAGTKARMSKAGKGDERGMKSGAASNAS